MEQKTIIYGLDGKEKETISLPKVFSLSPRFDLISRVVISMELSVKQPQGRDPQAGKRNTSDCWGPGFGVAKVPRRKGSGYPSARYAAYIPSTMGGRVAHPPRTQKILARRVNSKEKKLALLSAISATGIKEIVKNRGHNIEKVPSLPLVIDDKIQALKKCTDVIEIFSKLGLGEDIERAKAGKTIRAGKGKRRGRKYKNKKSVLVVIKEDFGIYKAARNLSGVDVVNINNLNCKDLSPGSLPGRLTLWSQSAFNMLNKMGEI
jgi:large subunit ribosomal protein L4e